MTARSPRRLGHYEVQSRLGEGGMGEVYLVKDRRDGHLAALKLLAPALASSEEARSRFVAEGRLAQQVEHPSLVSVEDLDEVHLKGADRTLFMTMELAGGRELLQILSVEEIPLAQVVAITRDVLSALEALHEAGYVHRDVKSANIKVGSDGRVKLLDLGLAAPPGAREPGVVGTLHYAAPEQLAGDPVDEAADVYSVGVVLYQMITGRLPFRGDSPDQVLSSIEGRRSKRLDRLVEGVPEEMQTLIDDMTATTAAERPGTEEASARLEGLLGELESAVQDGDEAPPISRFKSWLRRRRRSG
ncbi:MAG: serine/threonine-protein kinase [Acidobacteriota bacterium]